MNSDDRFSFDPVTDLRSFETMSGYHSLGNAHVDASVLATSLFFAGLCCLGLIIVMALRGRAVQGQAITRSALRRRLKVVGALAVATGLSGALPFALAVSPGGIWSMLLWEAAGAAVIAACVLDFSAGLVLSVRCADDDEPRRLLRVNPATGYPIKHSTVDIGGHAYGCGRDIGEDRHWEG